jgi:hypothetical protein
VNVVISPCTSWPKSPLTEKVFTYFVRNAFSSGTCFFLFYLFARFCSFGRLTFGSLLDKYISGLSKFAAVATLPAQTSEGGQTKGRRR